MTDETTPHSGSRWEPARMAATPTPTLAPAATPPARGRHWRSPGARHRGALAGAMVGLVAAGGLGGLALGHAAADGPGTRTDQVSQLRTSDDHPALPGQGNLPPATLPAPAPNSGLQGDLEGDDGPEGFGEDEGGGAGTTAQPGSQT